ncbi:MAG: hypothetical protein ABSG61_10800 [Gemmatimonadales bacterium]|jgi:hypothetical protein
MKRAPLAVLAAVLFALSCAEPYPSVSGGWEYASTLTFPGDFDLSPGQPYVCTYRAVLTLGQSNGTFSGTYDSLSVGCNSGGTTSGFNGTVMDGELSKSGIVSFEFDTPNWLSVGSLHGDSMGGVVTDSVNGLPGMELASGTWSACQGRVCK